MWSGRAGNYVPGSTEGVLGMDATGIMKDITLAEISALVPDPSNARKHNKRNVDEVAASLAEFGQHAPLVVQRSTNRVLVGNGRLEAMKALGWTEALVMYVDDDNITAVRRALADNRTAELAEWDDDVLAQVLREVGDLPVPGWNEDEIAAILAEATETEHGESPSLSDRFGIPPFSILDARQGYWQERKKEWLSLGIKSELGRGENLLKFSETVLNSAKR